MIVALAGNQNCGKTTLFNRLTGSRQHVGNWPGVTVERAEGLLLPKWQKNFPEPVRLVDLPGVYSLSPFSGDEAVTGSFLEHTPPDVLLNVVDALHPERNLYLTLQLLSLRLPMVIALTMVDRLAAEGGSVDAAALSCAFGVPVVPVCAGRGQGLDELLRSLAAASLPKKAVSVGGEAGRALEQLAACMPHNPRRTAETLLENAASQPPEHPARSVLQKLEAATGLPPDVALAAQRYQWLKGVTDRCFSHCADGCASSSLQKLLVCSPVSVPLFFGILLLVFWLAFGPPGALLRSWLELWTERLESTLGIWLQRAGTAPLLSSLLLDGVLKGVGSAFSFLPPMLILLFLLDLLEDSGYLTYAAFLLDRPLRGIGLSGRSLLPLAMGFGCTVPAVLGARGIRSNRERRLVILLLPLMSCSARLPVYGVLAQTFFPSCAPWIVLLLYLTGITAAAFAGWLVNRSASSEPVFLLELPPLRWPSLRNATRQTLYRCRDFFFRMLSLVLLVTLVVQLLESVTPRFTPAAAPEESLLGILAGLLAPLLAPCGFGTYQAAAALITGLAAKESILSTLAVLAGEGGMESLFSSPLSAFSFLLFTLFYTPCTAAMAAIRKELDDPAAARATGLRYLLAAWAASCIVYQLGSLLC